MKAVSRIALVLLALSAFARSAAAQSVEGKWEGSVVVDGMTIPFRIDISGKGLKLSSSTSTNTRRG